MSLDLLLTILSTGCGAVFGSLITILAQWFYERRRFAELEFSDKLYIEKFEYSVRVSLGIVHKSGRLPVHNAIGYLTIKAEGVKLRDLIVKKVSGSCEFSDYSRCERKYYLASVSEEDNEITSEPLPWSIPINCGTGLDNLKYNHIIHIPVGGRVYLRLFDIYKISRGTEEYYLIKVHSEYGTEYYPRVCLKLPVSGIKGTFIIRFEVTVAGENLKSSPRTEVRIESRDGDYVLFYPGDKPRQLRELLKDCKYLEERPEVKATQLFLP